MRVGIVGLGLMGGSLAMALGRARPDIEVVGTDADAATTQQAIAEGIVAGQDVDTADVIVLAAPIEAMEHILATLHGTRATVTDVASVKGAVQRWAAKAGVDLIGGHPMCGRERSGLAAARADLFQGAPWVLTRHHDTVEELVRAVGATPIVMDAERHDRLVAGVSHAAFFVSSAYVLALARGGDWDAMARLAGPGFRDMSRLAAGDPRLYAAVSATNRDQLRDTVKAVEEQLAAMRRHLEADGDPRALAADFEEARATRAAWEDGTG
jgi:prephenate dehydrogenase